jgi:predicted enzyme related to lactoylglutathione lyase
VTRGALIEFPADDPERARRFWEGVLGIRLEERAGGEGTGLQAREHVEAFLGVHSRGAGPGDRGSLPYFLVPDLERALDQVVALGGKIVHPGARWAVCRDSEGNPFGLGRA